MANDSVMFSAYNSLIGEAEGEHRRYQVNTDITEGDKLCVRVCEEAEEG